MARKELQYCRQRRAPSVILTIGGIGTRGVQTERSLVSTSSIREAELLRNSTVFVRRLEPDTLCLRFAHEHVEQPVANRLL